MTPEPYRPRENDHLVEPMFSGLGMTEEHERRDAGPGDPSAHPEPDPAARRPPRVRLILVVLGLVILTLVLLALR